MPHITRMRSGILLRFILAISAEFDLQVMNDNQQSPPYDYFQQCWQWFLYSPQNKPPDRRQFLYQFNETVKQIIQIECQTKDESTRIPKQYCLTITGC